MTLRPLFAALAASLTLAASLALAPGATAQEDPGPGAAGATPAAERPAASPLWLAAAAEGAIGVSGDGFYNQLVGGRLDYRPDPRFALGASLSYANLKGPNGRVSNVLPATMLEWRPSLGRRTTLPVRLVTGYLPKNGPWLKAALGLGQPLGNWGLLSVELFAPTLWVVRDQTVASLDVAAEIAFPL